MEATTNKVAAVVSPVTPPLECRIDPAPIKPIPGMICAAIRALSPGGAISAESMVNIAAPKQINMLVRRPAGRCFSSRSRPMMPPSAAASNKRRIVLESKSSSKWCDKLSVAVIIENPAWFQLPILVQTTVDGGPCLPRSLYYGNRAQPFGKCMDSKAHLVPLECDHIIGGPCRTTKTNQPLRMISFLQHATQRYTGLLKCGSMRSRFHHQGRSRRQFFQLQGEVVFKHHPRAPIGLSFPGANRAFLPCREITGGACKHPDDGRNPHRHDPGKKLEGQCAEDRDGGKHLQAITHVVVTMRPPLWKVNRHAGPGNAQDIERHWNPQQQCRPMFTGKANGRERRAKRHVEQEVFQRPFTDIQPRNLQKINGGGPGMVLPRIDRHGAGMDNRPRRIWPGSELERVVENGIVISQP